MTRALASTRAMPRGARARQPAFGGSTRARVVARANARRAIALGADVAVDETQLNAFLDSLKYDDKGLVCAIAQDVDTGAILMQGFASRDAVAYTLRNRKATFWSRSRSELWCKGETSGNFIGVESVHLDCDRDSLIYLGVPTGPTCHTGAHTCYYKRVDGRDGAAAKVDGGRHAAEEALTTLYELEATIEARRVEAVADDVKPSWTRRLLDNPELLCKKIREEAGELCQTWEENEGKEAATNEMADVLYHSMVMLNKQGVPMSDVLAVLRRRFGTSGVDEKAARPPKKLIDPSK
jgi:phosphoribosyl-ATP pyrophosphohydrolase/phosphoribosyl-AMP cyclohydrolase